MKALVKEGMALARLMAAHVVHNNICEYDYLFEDKKASWNRRCEKG